MPPTLAQRTGASSTLGRGLALRPGGAVFSWVLTVFYNRTYPFQCLLGTYLHTALYLDFADERGEKIKSSISERPKGQPFMWLSALIRSFLTSGTSGKLLADHPAEMDG